MANIVSYINRYASIPMSEMPYNDIDNVIFSSISYIDFTGLFKGSITLGELAETYFKCNSKKDINAQVIAVRSAAKLLRYIKDEVRYKDLLIHDYEYVYNDEEQFAAMCIDLDDKTTYISFEGTDELVSGWKEDFEFSYKFPVPSQKDAIKYVNKHIKLFDKRNYILGGHSKGGHLALVAGMYLNRFKHRHVISIISNDGPGLRDKEFFSRKYRRILPKYNLILTDQSIVGMLLYEHENPTVIKSNKKGIMAHDVLSWETKGNEFIPAELSKFSKNMDEKLFEWLERYSYDEREKFVKNLFAVLERADIDSLLDIKENKITSVIKIIKETRGLSKETKDMIKTLIQFVINIK